MRRRQHGRRHIAGIPPFGYRRRPNGRWGKDARAGVRGVVRRIFRLFSNSGSLPRIVCLRARTRRQSVNRP